MTSSTQPPAPPASTAVPGADAGAERLAYLFRDAARLGVPHPLQPLLQRYRSGERA